MPRDNHPPELLAELSLLGPVDSLLRAAVELSEPQTGIVPAFNLAPDDVIAGRFVVEQLASSGGMGTIHRARDLHTARTVAIKVMRIGDASRFAQEAKVLAALSHPAVVRYVAHGMTPMATQFIAMDWLDGEDLGQRLSREPLTVTETLLLFRRACEGVAAAHARGVVARVHG
jgi:eukaryotic-like serine/threonine-protein kinase